MDFLKAFVLGDKTYNVTILWENDKPLFRAREIGDIIDIKNVRMSLRTFDDDEKVVRATYTPGGEQITIFLTEPGVYRLLMLSRKPIARPFQKWVSQVITKIRETGKYELELQMVAMKEECENRVQDAIKAEGKKAIDIVAQNLHNSLIDAFKGPDRYVTYFGRIIREDENNANMLIKIGSSKNMKEIITPLQEEFGAMRIIHIVDCPMNEAFEKFLHKHHFIAPLKYSLPVTENHKSREVFEMTQDQLNKVMRIAKSNIHMFSSKETAEQSLQNQQMRLVKAIVRLNTVKAIENIRLLEHSSHNAPLLLSDDNASDNDDDNVDDDVIDPTILFADNRAYTQTRGDKLQCYSEDGEILIKTYAGYADAIRQLTIFDPSLSRIKAAVNNRTVYRGFRWALLERARQDDTKQDIGATVESIEINKGLIAMLNLDQSRIEKVYCDQKEAAKDRQLKSTGAVSNAMSNKSKCTGHYFFMWNKCSHELQNDYLRRNGNVLPSKRPYVHSQPVEKLHPVSEKLLHTYASVADVIKDIRIARTTLQKAAECGLIAKGYKWRFAANAAKACTSSSAEASTPASA